MTKPMGSRAGAALVVVVMVVGLSGCGTGSAAKKAVVRSTTTTKPQTLAQKYTAIVSGGDKALQQLSKQLNSANGDVVAIQSEFRSVSATYHRVATEVKALPFPTTMGADVDAMASALGALVSDSTQGSRSVTPSQFNDVFTKLAADQKTEVTANNAVNHDLGISSIN